MKNTARVRIQAGTKASASQRKIKPSAAVSAEFTLPDKDCHPGCVAIYDRESQEPVCKIPLSETEFFKIWERAHREGLYPKDWIAQNLRKALLIPTDDGFDSLENNCAKVGSLLELLGTKFDSIANREGSKFEGEAVDQFIFGVQLIVQDAQKSLRSAYQAAYAANHPRVVEVSA